MTESVARKDIIRLYMCTDGPLAEVDGRFFAIRDANWNELFNDASLRERLARYARNTPETEPPRPDDLLAPIGHQEVWAAGVTYWRSRTARMAESEETADAYDRVYTAARPEIFFKATPHRVAGPGQAVRIRRDTRWSVPEPELAVAINTAGEAFGYAIGNDMSARDIEGENPLYLPQAKVYDQCCGLGPCILVSEEPPGPDTSIRLVVERGGDRRLQGRNDAQRIAAFDRGTGYLPVSRQLLPGRLFFAHRHRHRASRRLHAGAGGPHPDRHRPHRRIGQLRRAGRRIGRLLIHPARPHPRRGS